MNFILRHKYTYLASYKQSLLRNGAVEHHESPTLMVQERGPVVCLTLTLGR